jgi:YbbR domain-containing protein
MKRLVFENFGLKISAVLLAIFLWFFVTSRGQSEISLEIPLEFRNIPAGLGIVGNTMKMVDVSIRGQERLIKNLKPADIRVIVDMSKANKGEFIYYISRDDVKLPYALAVTNVAPSSVKVKVEENVTKTVDVRPSITGEPEKGFYVKSVEVDPRSVIIHGFKPDVRRISELKTEVIDIAGLAASTAQDVDIDTGGANIKLDVGTVKVKIEIARRKR